MTPSFNFYCRVIETRRPTAEVQSAGILHGFFTRSDFSAITMVAHYALLEAEPELEPELEPDLEAALPLLKPADSEV